MKVISSPVEWSDADRRVCLAIGFFDGVHLGHQQVIRQMIADARQHEARAVVATFDCHPNTVVAPARAPRLIYPLARKLKVIADLQVEVLWLIHFDAAFSRQTGEEFVRRLVRDFGRVHSLCVGSSFTFGHQRSGNVALLQTLGRELKFTLHGLASVSLDGKAVSSTRIREAIREGRLDAASQMLGRAYSLCGTVIRGDQLGQRLGFPTANLDVAGLELPPTGVYAVHAEVGGRSHRAVVNIGHRPTRSDPTVRLHVEAHLLDDPGDLYGQEMALTFVGKLREERKFPSFDALKAQIEQDIAAARRIFG
jgi:riboflavin kinase/FMN adenylyltransferase